MTTWTDVIRHPFPAAFDGLKAAAREVGSVQIQNRGTLAGNICNASPAADGVPPLLTLEAVVEIASFQGVRQVRLSRFITGVRQIDLGEDEIVTALMIPPVAESAGSGFVKLGSRRHLVISIAMVSALVELDAGRISDLRLAVGSCAPVAKRLTQLEQKLTGMTPEEACNAELSADLFAPLSPISDVRGSADYRAEAVPELCRRALQKAVEGAS